MKQNKHTAFSFKQILLITGLLFLIPVLSACFQHKVKAFNPSQGMVCDEIIITGTFYHIGQLDGVWLNGQKIEAVFERFPAPNGPLRIRAKVPEGAETGLIKVKISTGWGFILGVIGTTHTFDKPYTVTGTPPIPVINAFSANPGTIKEGESTTLIWDLSTNVTRITINGAITPIAPETKTVSPATTTTYTLRAYNESCLVRSKSVTVPVIPLPSITTLDKSVYRPGENLKANGEGLKRTGEVSKLIFKQGANSIEVTDASPALTQLNALLPTSFTAGTASVQAKVGSDLSNEKTFTVDAYENGAFIEIKSSVNMTLNKSCMAKSMQITINEPNNLAVFTQGGMVLAQHNFTDGPISGSCFSPKCNQAVTLHFRPQTNDYLAVIERFESPNNILYNNFIVKIMDGFTTVPERWHCLFSPDDKIAILSTSASGGKMSYTVYDMKRNVSIASELGIACTGCALTARVIDGNKVEVIVNSGTFTKTHDIY